MEPTTEYNNEHKTDNNENNQTNQTNETTVFGNNADNAGKTNKTNKMSKILSDFKQAANPFYTAEYGYAVNQVTYWEKYFDQYVVLAYIGANKHLFVGEDARNFLYNIGDRDHVRFAGISEERKQEIIQSLRSASTTNSNNINETNKPN